MGVVVGVPGSRVAVSVRMGEGDGRKEVVVVLDDVCEVCICFPPFVAQSSESAVCERV